MSRVHFEDQGKRIRITENVVIADRVCFHRVLRCKLLLTGIGTETIREGATVGLTPGYPDKNNVGR
jgi:hypothetical protein